MNTAPAAIWNSLPAPGFLLDADNVLVDINPAAEHFLGMSAQKLRGTPVFDRLVIDAPLDGALARVRGDQAAVFVKNADVAPRNAATVCCNIQIAPLIGEPGAILMLIEPQKIADHLGRSQALKSSARSAIGMAEMLSHEIKNPLAGIIGAAQLLAMNLDAGGREMTELIVAESRRIAALLDQVEAFGDLRPPARRAVNIHDILERVRKSAGLGVAANMVISDDYDPSLPLTYVDPDQMMQVFQNLLKNASQAAGGQGGNLTIRTFYDSGLRLRRDDGSDNRLPLQVEIIDDGPGIPADIAADIFEPFVSGRDNGTGLGLALVSKIVAGHGGWISVNSVAGRTVFRVSLPVAPSELEGDP